MALDPSISLGVKTVEMPNMLAQYGQLAQLQNAQQQNQLHQMQMDEYARARQEEEGVRNYLRSTDLNAPSTQAGLLQFGKTGLEYSKQLQAQQTAALQQKSAQLKYNADLAEQAGRIYMGVKDQASWDAARPKLAALGGDPSKLPETYDPNYVASEIGQAIAVKDQWTATQPKLEQIKVGDKILFKDTNPRSPTFGKEMMPSQAMGVTPGEILAHQDRAARLNWEKANPNYEIKDTDSGLVAVNKMNPADVKPVTMGGTQVQGTKGLTESQAKATGFASRAKAADKILTDLKFDPWVVASKQSVEGTIGGGPVAAGINAAMSPENQKADQAQRDFVNAVLRQESGAAISEAEFENARKQYFPQPGDKPAAIQQKAANRANAIKSLETIAGPGLKKSSASKVVDFGSLQ